MKVEGWLFIGLGGFLIGADVVYWYLSYDPTGTVLIALGVGLALLAGFYVLFTGKRLPLRPDDNPSAEVHEGTGSLGFFSPHSWWPLWVGLAGAVTATGFAVGWWLFLIGVVSMFFAAVGFVFEYYRGAFKH
ncbi:MAG TPA: cytochrome c oxidase subunit 4 [Trebonia sp.]|nr:cytochrome c oxidase subunit 4 [Trebonia sp.]